MAGTGGKRPGAGRPKGKLGAATIRRMKFEDGVAESMAAGDSPLQYMLRVMRDKNSCEAARLDAAKAASPYIHPRLSNVQVTNTNMGDMTDDELHELIADIRALKGRG